MVLLLDGLIHPADCIKMQIAIDCKSRNTAQDRIMLDETRKAINRSHHPYAVIARLAGISHATIYGLFEPDANPTIKTLERIMDTLLSMPNKTKTSCVGCRHCEAIESLESENDAVLCALRSSPAEPTGCARYETP